MDTQTGPCIVTGGWWWWCCIEVKHLYSCRLSLRQGAEACTHTSTGYHGNFMTRHFHQRSLKMRSKHKENKWDNEQRSVSLSHNNPAELLCLQTELWSYSATKWRWLKDSLARSDCVGGRSIGDPPTDLRTHAANTWSGFLYREGRRVAWERLQTDGRLHFQAMFPSTWE